MQSCLQKREFLLYRSLKQAENQTGLINIPDLSCRDHANVLVELTRQGPCLAKLRQSPRDGMRAALMVSGNLGQGRVSAYPLRQGGILALQEGTCDKTS